MKLTLIYAQQEYEKFLFKKLKKKIPNIRLNKFVLRYSKRNATGFP